MHCLPLHRVLEKLRLEYDFDIGKNRQLYGHVYA